jgi:hypothetical protein
MPLQFILFLVTVLGLISAIMVGMTVSETMRIDDYIRILGVFSPILIVGVLVLKRFWIGVAIGLLPIGYALPVRVIGAFGVNIIFACMIFALVLGAYCMGQYRKPIVHNAGGFLMVVSFLFLFARIIYDRPGSAFLGAEGGGRQAFNFLFGFFAFWAFSKLTAESEWNPMLTLKVMFMVLLGAWFQELIQDGLPGGPMGVIANAYKQPAWLLASIVPAWIIYHYGFGKGPTQINLLLFLITMAIIGVSAFAGFRSRPLFAVGTLLVVAYVFRYHRQMITYLAASSVVGVIILASLGRDAIPASVLRTLSTFFPVPEGEQMRIAIEGGTSHEMGWESDFRAKLYELAWKKISGNPIFGDGFSFSTEDLISVYGATYEGLSAGVLRLAMVGGYHNSILQLAVGAGLVAGGCALLGMIFLCYRGIRIARRQTDLKNKLFCACLVGFLPPLMGQMLMNGSGKDFFIVCLVVGVVNGIQINPLFNPDEKQAVDSEPQFDEDEAAEPAALEPVHYDPNT